MIYATSKEKTNWVNILPGIAVFVLLIAILLQPELSYRSALSGLNIFLQSVFPALLPFFIVSEIMIGLGIVDFLSVILTPVMKPLFHCPGNSSFIWVMSFISGYPTGAKLTAEFLKKNMITEYEAQRILSFSSTSGPLFMIGAVAIGMLGSAEAGIVILFSHYSAAIFLGLLFRFYSYRDGKKKMIKIIHRKKVTIKSKTYKKNSSFGIKQALSALIISRKKDGRPLGQLLGDAVRNSVNTLFVVGGFIVLFSVIIQFLINPVTNIFFKAFIGGLFEVTTGCRLISMLPLPMDIKIFAASLIIGWSGLSIQAQSISFLSGTGVNIGLFLIGKAFHGILAAIISIPLTHLLYPDAVNTYFHKNSIYIPYWQIMYN